MHKIDSVGGYGMAITDYFYSQSSDRPAVIKLK